MLKKDHSHLKISKIVNTYKNKAKQGYLVLSGLLMGLSTATFYLFQAEGPFIGMDQIGLSPEEYGSWASIPPFGMAIGSLLVSFVTYKLPYNISLATSICLYFIISVIMLLAFSQGAINTLTLFIPTLLLLILIISIYTNASAHALDVSRDKAHTSAFMQMTNLLVTSLAVFTLSIIKTSSSLLLPVMYVLDGIFMFVIFIFLLKMFKTKES